MYQKLLHKKMQAFIEMKTLNRKKKKKIVTPPSPQETGNKKEF